MSKQVVDRCCWQIMRIMMSVFVSPVALSLKSQLESNTFGDSNCQHLLMTTGGTVIQSIVRWHETQNGACIIQSPLVSVHCLYRFMNLLAGNQIHFDSDIDMSGANLIWWVLPYFVVSISSLRNNHSPLHPMSPYHISSSCVHHHYFMRVLRYIFEENIW